MNDWRHILERSLLHLGYAPWAFLLARRGLGYLGRKRPKFALQGEWRYVGPALAAWLVIFLREPLDVARGGPVGKSYVDFVVWGLSLVAAALVIRWDEKHGRNERGG